MAMNRGRKRDGTLSGALTGLRRAERELTGQLESLRKVIRSIESGETRGGSSGKTRNLSAKGRAAIAKAARKRWAAYRAAKAGKRK